MTDFTVQAKLAEDRELLARIAACAASMGEGNPLGWAYEHAWQFAVRSGWCCSASDMVEGEHAHDQAGITDAMILAAVTEIRAAETPPE